jgi:site-specific DNA recombinase
VSTPFLHGEAKTASAGSVSRIPAGDIEDVIVKYLKEHLAAKQDKSTIGAVRIGARGDMAQLIAGIVVYKDRLVVQLKSDSADEASDCTDDLSLSIPWQKPPSKRSRESCSRVMRLEAKSVRSNSSAGRAWSAQSPEVVGGWMMLFQVV